MSMNRGMRRPAYPYPDFVNAPLAWYRMARSAQDARFAIDFLVAVQFIG